MISVYLAAQYERRLELLGYAATLRAMGYKVTSRWLNGHHEKPPGERYSFSDRAAIAEEDYEDLLAADILVTFTEPEGSRGLMRGGRHVEFGLAYMAGKTVYIVGEYENVFYCLPDIIRFDSWPSALIHLRRRAELEEKHAV